MKKVYKLPCLLLFALIILFTIGIAGFTGGRTAAASVENDYSFYFEKYDVTFDVATNRKLSVTEELTVHFTGKRSTGFIKDIPVNAGEQVKNVNVYEIVNGVNESTYFGVSSEDSDFISVDIGDATNKYEQSHTFLITYDYCLTSAQEGKDVLLLNAIGVAHDNVIEQANITINLPEGFKGAQCFSGELNSQTQCGFETYTSNGKTVLEIKNLLLNVYEGVTFKMDFEEGTLSTYFDATPIWYALAAFGLFVLMIIVKLLVFNKNTLTPVVNYEAPNKMDPLIMGKLIDNKVNSEDITSLIYYWASNGHIKINLDDKDDPKLIRISRHLPATSEKYEQYMYEELFRSGDMVSPNNLKGTFYRTVEGVTAQVNNKAKGLYDNMSIGVSIIFAVLGGLLLGLVPFLLAFTQISNTMIYLPAFISLVPALIIYALTETVMYYRLKLGKGKVIALSTGIAALCIILTLIYTFLVPSSIIGIAGKIALCLVCFAIITCSVSLISRTEDYTKKLNDIVGFRNFIMLAEKDKLEMLLEDDPQFYYHILPYAQVLGVSDKWEEKFAALTVQPPQWLTGNMLTTVIEFRIINNIIRSSMGRMSASMISRPSSSGLSGGGHGGFGGFGGGSFTGGGHGGGGFRGR